MYPSELDEEKALRIGASFGAYLISRGVRTCIVGRDNRSSSESLANAFIEGITQSAGLGVLNIGLAPSSTLCFALMNNPQYAGASITASHNPVAYNGIKFYNKGLVPLSAEELAFVRTEFERNAERPKAARPGNVENGSYNGQHAAYVAAKHRPGKKIKVVVDCGNSVCSLVALPMLGEMGIETVPLFCEPDGRFPNHLPDPHKRENYAAISEKVVEEGADLGIMFDGDGDRAGFCDESGEIIEGDFVHIMFLRNLLSRKKGAVAVLDLRLSRAVFEEVKLLGGKAVMSKAGRMAIHEEMGRLNADYGGEVTGHISFAENGGNDDAFWSAALLIRILSESNQPVSRIISMLPHYESLPELRIPCPNEKKFSIVESAKAALTKEYPGKVSSLDGARLDINRAWGLVRVSNTEPQITLRFEGNTKKDLEDIYAVFVRILGNEGVELPSIEDAAK